MEEEALDTATIAVATALATIMIMAWRGIEVGIALITATAIIAATNPQKTPEIIVETIRSQATWTLTITSMLIAILAELYRNTGEIKKLGTGVAKTLKNPKLAAMITPAIIGLLPIAGGALMSAPIIESLTPTLNLDTETAVYTNVWFRHTIFLTYPITNVMIAIAALTGASITEIAIQQIPTTIFMIIIGYITALHGKKVDRETGNAGEGNIKAWETLKAATPLILSLTIAIPLKTMISDTGMIIGVAMGVAAITLTAKVKPKEMMEAVKSRRTIGITLASFSSMLLQQAFNLTGATQAITQSINSTGIPAEALQYIAPALLGLLTGSPLTGIVLSLPIIGGIKRLDTETISAIYISSYTAYIASPIHLCYVYTARYFNCKLSKAYKLLVPSVIATITFTIILYTLT
jgi:integral membrane protein (TIGR00529 family)